MKIIYLVFYSLFIQTLQAQSNIKDSNIIISNRSKVYVLKPSDYTIIPLDNNFPNWIFKDVKPATLTIKEIIAIERILDNCIDTYNQNRIKKNVRIIPVNLINYKRQYIAITNKKGEKEVWVNCFCNVSNSDWKKNLVFAKDGGLCYFNVKINLSKKKYYNLMFNGNA